MLKSVYDPANIAAQLAGRTVSNTFLAAQLVSLSSLGTTPTTAFSLINPTAAAAGAQQSSPGLSWEGQGWKTDATAASQPVAFRASVLPIQGSSAPQVRWYLKSQINGGALVDAFTVDSNGLATAGSYLLTGTVAWSGLGGIAFPANGQLQFFTNGFSNNASLLVGSASGQTIRFGTGDPEGAVTAPVGSMFLRTDGGTDTTLYIKESGAGNTGWAAI